MNTLIKLDQHPIIEQSTRSKVITRRSYNRPLNAEGTLFESWEQTVARVIEHQKWLWERAIDKNLNVEQHRELEQLRTLHLLREASLAGRTLWLGGTDIAKRREASQFNCSFTKVNTVYDLVDVFWLLLQGCGVGFKMEMGALSGFQQPLKTIRTIRSQQVAPSGEDFNTETFNSDNKEWTLRIGDSAEAWAKALGKLIIHKYPARHLIFDFSPIRPSGYTLKGYGWISSGDDALCSAFVRIAKILSNKAQSLLSKVDILDLCNLLGTTLSSRRSAEIALMDYGDAEWKEFATAKKDWWLHDNEHRQQSNNSLMFQEQPSISELQNIFDMMQNAGGSEPGFINAQSAKQRAEWFEGVNPCGEVLLTDKSFCNLAENDIGKFHNRNRDLHKAIYLMSRASYRQTCVNLRDGMLQEAWHTNNQFLRLCGVSLTGIASRPDFKHSDFVSLERTATYGGYSMADELGLPQPKNITTVKPSGTLGKIMDTTEGMHKPLGRYIFNNIKFSKDSNLVDILTKAGYQTIDAGDPDSVIITMPVEYKNVEFETVNGVEVNTESAVSQLSRYKTLMQSWCQQNVSSTISYSPEEVPQIISWLSNNWDNYVGVSFLYRTDPTKTANDLGYAYLPQEVVTKADYDKYKARLKPVQLDNQSGLATDDIDDACATGSCPMK